MGPDLARTFKDEQRRVTSPSSIRVNQPREMHGVAFSGLRSIVLRYPSRRGQGTLGRFHQRSTIGLERHRNVQEPPSWKLRSREPDLQRRGDRGDSRCSLPHRSSLAFWSWAVGCYGSSLDDGIARRKRLLPSPARSPNRRDWRTLRRERLRMIPFRGKSPSQPLVGPRPSFRAEKPIRLRGRPRLRTARRSKLNATALGQSLDCDASGLREHFAWSP